MSKRAVLKLTGQRFPTLLLSEKRERVRLEKHGKMRVRAAAVRARYTEYMRVMSRDDKMPLRLSFPATVKSKSKKEEREPDVSHLILQTHTHTLRKGYNRTMSDGEEFYKMTSNPGPLTVPTYSCATRSCTTRPSSADSLLRPHGDRCADLKRSVAVFSHEKLWGTLGPCWRKVWDNK